EYKNIPTPRGYKSGKFKQVNCFFSGLQLTNITDTTYDEDNKLYSVLPSILTIFQVLGEQYSALTYLGPLREEPKRRYFFDETTVGVGIKGEYAPLVYYSNDFRLQRMPIISNENILSFDYHDCSYHEAIHLWLNYLEINKIDIQNHDEIIRLLLDNGIDGGVNIADVGFGISQTFPIIVEALRLTKRSTLLLEQPEIPLHPKMHMKLADFFIGMAMYERTTIVETHSDHIINRLVRRIMDDESNSLNKMIGIYFITQNDSESSIAEIEIDPVLGIV
ncbi:AAA family ATPase, partial [Clostridium perfringens]